MQNDAKFRLTIAIPYRDNLAYLKIAIESVIAQSCKDFICVVLDDSLTGEAASLTRKYEPYGVQYLRNDTPVGIARNWNNAIDIAKTEYLTIFHADDVMERDFVLRTLETLGSKSGVAAVHCRATLIDADGIFVRSLVQFFKDLIRPRYRHGQILSVGDCGLRSLLRADWIICPTMTYRVESLGKLRFDDNLKFALDLDLMGRLLLNKDRILGINTFEYRYRLHVQSQTSRLSLSGVRFLEEWNVINRLGQHARKEGWRKSHRTSNHKAVLRAHLFVTAVRLLSNRKPKQVRTLLRWAVLGPTKDELRQHVKA